MTHPYARALSRCVGDVDDFAATRWGNGSSVHCGTEPFDDLFDLDAFDRLVGASLPTSVVDVITSGELVDECSLVVEERDRGTAVRGAIDPAKVTAAYRGGATVALRSLPHLWPPLRDFTAELERSTGLRNYAQAFLTPPGGRGLRPHIDHHDVFVMQVSGNREWWAEDIGHVTLHPGEVLYMPIGTRHRARSVDTPSIHISIAILANTYRELVMRLLESGTAWLDEPLPLPINAEPNDVARRLGEHIDRACQHLRSIDLDQAARLQLERLVRPLPAGTGALKSAVLSATIDDDSLVSPATLNQMRVHPGYGGQVVLRTPDSLISLPEEYEPALHRIASGGPFRVGSLAELEAPSREALVRRLIEHGFLEMSTA
ncbi:MAG: cupin domain-containing protein [Acidimicrobiales bacterium]